MARAGIWYTNHIRMERKGEPMTEIRQTPLTGERTLFQGSQLHIIDSIFSDGESPLKESRDIQMIGSMFK